MAAVAKRKTSGLFDNVKTLVYAALIAIGIRTIAFEPFNIPSGSMMPTLLVGDYLFVSKFSYGYSHYSLPFSPDIFSGRIFGSLPTRGDVAVFKWPRDDTTDYIKRIVGLPGDHIQMKGGFLYINGQQLPRVPDGDYDNDGEAGRLFMETLPNGVKHVILKKGDIGGLNDTQDYLVPPGYLFAMGDNRDNSSDSRVPLEDNGVGFVPVENLIGKAQFIFFSIDAQDPWWEFWEWPFEIRWGRILKGIH